jgi:tagaturonate reductase
MTLSRKALKEIPKTSISDIPAEPLFELPEKVLQFGTGVLLRGLPDYFIDKANKQRVFNGRIVVVKSTVHGDTDTFTRQDNLYTICVRGVQKGKTVDEMMINASISRVLSAGHQWREILVCAANPEMQIVISNTTEAGLVLVEDNPDSSPPVSFPGKLLAFLLERYRCFNGSPESGMVIIPTELIPDNGTLLKRILITKSRNLKLDENFIHWLETANAFCSSLVDCIVPGSPPEADKREVSGRLGYEDDLMIMSEVYRLWAIESSSERARKILSFSKTDKRIIITPDISKFRELKLRLLNGSHTFTCGLAVWAGFPFVKAAMENKDFDDFITTLLLDEIVPALQSEKITTDEAGLFANEVLDRFRNPFIQHRWLSICLQYTSKMKTRNVPTIQQYYEKKGNTPRFMAAGFAAWLLFMRSEKKNGNQFAGIMHGIEYILQDDFAEKLNTLWNNAGTNMELLVSNTLKDTSLWGTNLTAYRGFAEAVLNNLRQLMELDPSAFFKKMVIR